MTEAQDGEKANVKVWTIGHSTLALDVFLNLLELNEIKALADVRSFPSSRRYPHFNRDALKNSLESAGIEYVHFPELGGRRKARPDSANIAWRNESFRGYADYMETDAFREGIERLLAFAQTKGVAIMCAEAVWWKCHRSLISDFLKSSGVDVIHITSTTTNTPHPYTSAARIIDGKLSYRSLLML